MPKTPAKIPPKMPMALPTENFVASMERFLVTIRTTASVARMPIDIPEYGVASAKAALESIMLISDSARSLLRSFNVKETNEPKPKASDDTDAPDTPTDPTPDAN